MHSGHDREVERERTHASYVVPRCTFDYFDPKPWMRPDEAVKKLSCEARRNRGSYPKANHSFFSLRVERCRAAEQLNFGYDQSTAMEYAVARDCRLNSTACSIEERDADRILKAAYPSANDRRAHL